MNTLTRWIRQVHRWLAIPFLTAIVILIIGTIQQGEDYISPGWLGALGIGAILSLALTGLYMFLHHYITKWRRAARNKHTSAAVDS